MKRILVVEDSPTIQYLIGHTLADQGYQILAAADGEDAVRVVTQEKPDLVLLDVILPKLNGYQVCREVKAHPETASIPVIMITSKAKDSDRHWGMEQGADGYLIKPVSPTQLLEIVGRFLPRPSSEKSVA